MTIKNKIHKALIFTALAFVASSAIVSCEENFDDFYHAMLEEYYKEAERLDTTDKDSMDRFFRKVNKFSIRYPIVNDDPLFTRIMDMNPNKPAVVEVSITGATWGKEVFIGFDFGKEKESKNEEKE